MLEGGREGWNKVEEERGGVKGGREGARDEVREGGEGGREGGRGEEGRR